MRDLERYLRDVVHPTIKDLEAEPTSVRLTFLACVAVFHGVDYLSHPRRPGNRRNQFRKQSPAFDMVDRVAHAFKHVESDGEIKVRAIDVVSRPPALAGRAKMGTTLCGDAAGGVTLWNDRDVNMMQVLRDAVAFLESQIRPDDR